MISNLRMARERHPLCNRRIDFSLSWQECKEKLDKAEKASDIIEALHNGINAEVLDEDEFRECIFWYLEMAYGYNSIGLFSLPEDRRDETFHTIFGRCTVSDARKKIAQKAWAMLCQKVFKNTGEKESTGPSWWWIVKDDPQILNKILWFFSEKDNIPSGIIYANEHNKRIASDFLYTIAQLAWINHLESGWGYGESPLSHFVENRPKFIKILRHLGKLDFLAKKNNWRSVTKEDLAVLEETALFQDNSQDEGQKYKTVKEAAYAGSQAAQVLIVLRVILKEETHQEKIEEAKRKMEEAKEKIEALNA